MPGKRLTMRKIREVLRLKFDFHLTNRKIAESVGAARSSIGEYLRRLRIDRAAEQLATGSQPLAEIALAAGFADQSHFSNVFRRRVGMSPSAYRREVRGRG